MTNVLKAFIEEMRSLGIAAFKGNVHFGDAFGLSEHVELVLGPLPVTAAEVETTAKQKAEEKPPLRDDGLTEAQTQEYYCANMG